MSAGASCSSGSSPASSCSNMGYSNPLYTYGDAPNVPLSDFVGAGSFWIGRRGLPVLLAVLRGHPGRARAPAVAARDRSWRSAVRLAPDAPATRPRRRLRSSRSPPSRWRRPAPTLITTSRSSTATRPRDDAEKFSADYERKYLKYEKLPQPSITTVTLDVQLYPEGADVWSPTAATTSSTRPTRRSATSTSASGDRDDRIPRSSTSPARSSSATTRSSAIASIASTRRSRPARPTR